jgi:hypothetical protein
MPHGQNAQHARRTRPARQSAAPNRQADLIRRDRGGDEVQAVTLRYKISCTPARTLPPFCTGTAPQSGPFEARKTGSLSRCYLLGNARRSSAAQNGSAWSRRYGSGLRDRSADFERSWKLISIAVLAPPLAASWQSAFCTHSSWLKSPCRSCAMSKPRTVADSSGGELSHASVENRFLTVTLGVEGRGLCGDGGRLGSDDGNSAIVPWTTGDRAAFCPARLA